MSSETGQESPQINALASDPLVTRVIEVIREEAVEHGLFHEGVCSVILSRSGETRTLELVNRSKRKGEYRFQTRSGAPAIGSISARAWEALSPACHFVRSTNDWKSMGVLVARASSLSIELKISAPAQAVSSEPVSSETVSSAASFALPVCAERAPDQVSFHAHNESTKRSRVLLVEDNQTFASVVSRFLVRHGFEPIHVSNGEAAWKHLASQGESIELIISDVHMPKMNGVEFLGKLRAIPALKNIPILMLTSDADIELELRALRSGASLLLLKSVDPRLICLHAQRLAGMELSV